MVNTFDYHRPSTLEKACGLLAELPEVQVLAGGTDLLVDLDTELKRAQHIISLKGISELKQIHEADTQVSLGATLTARAVQLSSIIKRRFPEIVDMVADFASPQIRSQATLGGNICSAVPCADFPVILIALGAEVELTSRQGSRVILLKDFFTGPRETTRQQGEILTQIIIPTKPPTAAAGYLKYQRRATNSLAVASVAAYLDSHDGVCREARIVLGAVAPTPMLAERASASLAGDKVAQGVIEKAASLACKESSPITDVRGTADYRRELVSALTKRALRQVAEKLIGCD